MLRSVNGYVPCQILAAAVVGRCFDFFSIWRREIQVNMESQMNQLLTEVGKVPEVTGVICTDQHGLCLGVEGNMSTCHAGLIASLAECGRSLRQDAQPPVITMESERGQILMLKSSGNISFGIMKTAPPSWH